jgi:hypothetical protein
MTTPPPKEKKENLFLKKNLTILNYSLLNAVGKVEKSPYDPEYVKQKERAKLISQHYKEVQKSKKLLKGLEELKEGEKFLIDTVDQYGETYKSDWIMSPRKNDPFYKAENEFGATLANTSKQLKRILEIQTGLEESVKKFYDGITSLEHDCKVLLDLKEKYRILKLDYDQKLHALNVLKKGKGVEYFKLYSATQEADQAKKEMSEVYVSLMDELEYNKRQRDVEYANRLKELMISYQDFFKKGVEIAEPVSPFSDIRFERKRIFTKAEKKEIAVFGVDIEDLIEREGPTPNLIKILLFNLKKNVDKEGLFRINGEQPEIDKLKRSVDEGDYNFELTDTHVVASVFKLYFRSLPTPLFTFKLYSNWIELSDLVTDPELMLEKTLILFAAVPFSRRYIIGLILDLLYDITQASGSKMNSTALAICWGNNLFKSSDPNPQFLMKETGKIHKVLEFMISNYPKIKKCFDEKFVAPEPKKRIVVEKRQDVPQRSKMPLPVLPGMKKERTTGFDSPPESPIDALEVDK